jgi:hypothetical protein
MNKSLHQTHICVYKRRDKAHTYFLLLVFTRRTTPLSVDMYVFSFKLSHLVVDIITFSVNDKMK